MNQIFKVSLLITFIASSLIAEPVVDPPRNSETIDYVRDVLPIFENHCMFCHVEGDAEGGFVMENFKGLMKGGVSGPSITPHSATSSRLFMMAAGRLEPVMPPDGEDGPTEEELEILEKWIDQGAPGPKGMEPIRRVPEFPSIKTRSGIKTPITAIAAEHESGAVAKASFGLVTIEPPNDEIVEIGGDFGKVNSLEFSSDGNRLVIASGVAGSHGSVLVVDSKTGETLHSINGHRDVLYDAVPTPDGKKLVSAGYDRDIQIWNLTEKEGDSLVLAGHNGAIFDLDISPDGRWLLSGCADETAKIWDIETGERLKTLSQPEGEVYAVTWTPDGKHMIAGSSDNRIRVWRFDSQHPRAQPKLIATRFVDDTAVIDLAIDEQSHQLIIACESGNLRRLSLEDFRSLPPLEPVLGGVSDIKVDQDDSNGAVVLVATLDGRIERQTIEGTKREAVASSSRIQKVYLDLGEPKSAKELASDAATDQIVGRNVFIAGSLKEVSEKDIYRFSARSGEVWAIEADPMGNKEVDPIVTVIDENNAPVIRTRLQAVRDSYFTFRGKDSKQIGDFRLFGYTEMKLNDYLYASGEVTRLFLHPRGPDSGFNVYPNEGNRWTYFGTSHATHALGEPAYVVRELADQETPAANGLPVFEVPYQNDDDPQRIAGKGSRLVFVAPNDGDFGVRIEDTRGDGGDGFEYRLAIRPAKPSFNPKAEVKSKKLFEGCGRQMILRADRFDEFDGPVTIHAASTPEGIRTNLPVTIEAGQRYAPAVIWPENGAKIDKNSSLQLVATSLINGVHVERSIAPIDGFENGGTAKIVPRIEPLEGNLSEGEELVLRVRPGGTITARVVVDRINEPKAEIPFGKENAGRTPAFGVYVDNIGLNGLLVRSSETEREFFLTADPATTPGTRSFFLVANREGGLTTLPVTLEVLP
ncbi:MAG: c-type cytochrome domain-containing protein [Planctomycetota bacterium]